MPITIALAGDTMLGRLVADRLATVAPEDLVTPDLAELTRAADLFVLNLECCVSERGDRWPDPTKPFFFRAPPAAVDTLLHLGVDAVTLANNHALDYGPDALLDTLDLLRAAGIRAVGAGADVVAAREPAVLAAGGLRVAVVGATDHPEGFAAGDATPGVAFAPLHRSLPHWLRGTVATVDAEVVLVTPHWGPNMTTTPLGHVRRAAEELLAAGATVVAGHSAHVFHGAALPHDPARAVLYDLGDFLDDYAVDPRLRNDLGLLWQVTVTSREVTAVEAFPLRLRLARTELARGDDRAWVVRRLRTACAAFGAAVEDAGDRLVLTPAA